MPPDVAILCPTYNGGPLLASSVRSCAEAQVGDGQARVFVVDNASTDGSPEGLPRTVGGIDVEVHRSATNHGRVGNWNRAIDIAREAGFERGLFLFVGDRLLPGQRLGELVDVMTTHRAGLALVAYEIHDEAGRRLSSVRRFGIPARLSLIGSRALLDRAIPHGVLPCGPLQASIVALKGLRFDEGDGSHADQKAVLTSLVRDESPVVLSSTPMVAWTQRQGRFHASMDPVDRFRKDLELMEAVAASAGIPVARRKRNAYRLLSYVKARKVSPILRRDWRRLVAHAVEGGGFSWPTLAGATLRHGVLRKPLLDLMDARPVVGSAGTRP